MGRKDDQPHNGHKFVARNGRRLPFPQNRDGSASETPDLSTVQSLLTTHISEQRFFIAGGFFEEFEGLNRSARRRRRILDTFMSTLFFKEFYKGAIQESLTVRDQMDEPEYRRRLAGQALEAFGHPFMAARHIGQGNVILPPQAVSSIYHDFVYPTQEVVHHPFGVDTISHRGTPDGLIVRRKNSKVLGAIEYTLSELPEKFQRQYKSFVDVRKKSDLFPDDATLTFVVTQDAKVPTFGNDVDVVRLPFTAKEFGRFVEKVYRQYQPETDDGTLSDLYAYAHATHDQITARSERGQVLTPGEEVYLGRRGARPALTAAFGVGY
jgi:hypothetical protein